MERSNSYRTLGKVEYRVVTSVSTIWSGIVSEANAQP